MSRIVSMKLPTVHRPMMAPNHRSGQHFANGIAKGVGNARWQLRQNRCDRQPGAVGLAEYRRQGGGDDEEGKQRCHRQEGEVPGVDEAVVVDADRDPLDDLERAGARLQLGDDLMAERRFKGCEPLAPGFR